MAISNPFDFSNVGFYAMGAIWFKLVLVNYGTRFYHLYYQCLYFKHGINGLTGTYSLLTISSLYYININIVNITSPDFLIVIGLLLIIFNFFNFRKLAKCFAGDMGNVSGQYIINMVTVKCFVIVLYNCLIEESESYNTVSKALTTANEKGCLYIYDNSLVTQVIKQLD